MQALEVKELSNTWTWLSSVLPSLSNRSRTLRLDALGEWHLVCCIRIPDKGQKGLHISREWRNMVQGVTGFPILLFTLLTTLRQLAQESRERGRPCRSMLAGVSTNGFALALHSGFSLSRVNAGPSFARAHRRLSTLKTRCSSIANK